MGKFIGNNMQWIVVIALSKQKFISTQITQIEQIFTEKYASYSRKYASYRGK